MVILIWYKQPQPLLPGKGCKPGEIETDLHMTAYSAETEVENFSEDFFRVNEHVTYTKQDWICVVKQDPSGSYYSWELISAQEGFEKDLPTKLIYGANRGLLVHEATIPRPKGYVCCPNEIKVTVKNLPYNSFYDAPHSENLNVDEYLGNVSVTWEANVLSQGVMFAYLPSPFHNLRSLVTPFIEFSKNDNWILATFGLVVSSILLLIVRPYVIGVLNDRLKKGLKKDEVTPQRKSPKRRVNRNP